MTPLSQLWLDELKLLHPDIFKKDVEEDGHLEWSTLDTFDEYWHVYFNPYTLHTIIYAQCGKDFCNNPEFIEKATKIAKDYYTKHFYNMLTIILDMLQEAHENNIAPTLITIPNWIIKTSLSRNGIRDDFKHIPKLNQLFGIHLTSDSSNIIRIENKEKHYINEAKYE